MKFTVEEIEARKAKSREKYQEYRQREIDIKEGRKYFREHKLPLLVAFPANMNFGVYITFKPVDHISMQVAFAIRSRKDADSPRKVRGILGHRLKTQDKDTVILLKATMDHHCDFLAKDGDWSFVKLYRALGYVVLGEIMHWTNCPKWLNRALRNYACLDFMDYRLVKCIDGGWPVEAINIAQRYYEQSWPKPPVMRH